MPDRPLTVLTYAASASLAAVAFAYFFHPSFLFDGESGSGGGRGKKKGVVGLSNTANDCFINCILQSLAGLGSLRVYLIREVHRRELGGSDIYGVAPVSNERSLVKEKKTISLQNGEITRLLKDMIDALNERPLYKKTVSAQGFIRGLEDVFGTPLSRAQQDAQEFLQLIAERLNEEYDAGCQARGRFRKRNADHDRSQKYDSSQQAELVQTSDLRFHPLDRRKSDESQSEEGFPFLGQTKSIVECQTCHFVPKTKAIDFVMLNIMVPHKSSTSLSECFDAHFKTEYIDDYKCDKCRIQHAIEVQAQKIAKIGDAANGESRHMQEDLSKLQSVLANDPEKTPDNINLPDIKLAPKRQIARHVEVTSFPRILVIHLSRSLYSAASHSTKNTAKVSFPEHFPIGGILNRREYKLLGIVTHQGTHQSGHYSTYRRQHAYAPFSNPHHDHSTGPYGKTVSPEATAESIPMQNFVASSENPRSSTDEAQNRPFLHMNQERQAHESDMRSSSDKAQKRTTSEPIEGSPQLQSAKERTGLPRSDSFSSSRFKRMRKPADRWYLISDDKVNECKTSDVLDLKREVYMLFYEAISSSASHK